MIDDNNANMPLDLEVQELDALWGGLQLELEANFGKKPDLQAVLFLVGVQELGQLREFAKEEKQDLMHLAICKLLHIAGHYEFLGKDEDGWGHYRLIKELPEEMKNLEAQENLLKKLVLQYFNKI